jgi:hypothetical protein
VHLVLLPNRYHQDTWDSWDELSDESKVHWTALGWAEGNWETGVGFVPTETKDWAELNEEEQRSAVALDFTQEKWDGVVPSEKNLWDVLPGDDRINWETLGWSSENWDTGTSPIEELGWVELGEEQRSAALALGFDQDQWDL